MTTVKRVLVILIAVTGVGALIAYYAMTRRYRYKVELSNIPHEKLEEPFAQLLEEYEELPDIEVKEVSGDSEKSGTHRVTYYPPVEDYLIGDPHDISGLYESLEAARAAIHKAVGNHGKWQPEEALEAWYAGDSLGSGGYEITEA